jgi:hypothetical protein
MTTDKLETCRACLDEQRDGGDWGPAPAADFILWGKLLPPEHLGPRCYDHAREALGWAAMSRIDQYAVFDLRPIRKALTHGQ